MIWVFSARAGRERRGAGVFGTPEVVGSSGQVPFYLEKRQRRFGSPSIKRKPARGQMLLKHVAGTYQPSFFIIRIDADCAIEQVAAENRETFLHEYVHLLQDLTLPYAIRASLAQLRAFFLQIDTVKAAGEIKVPFTLNDDETKLLELQAKFTWGSEEVRRNVKGVRAINKHCEPIPEYGFNVCRFDLELELGDDPITASEAEVDGHGETNGSTDATHYHLGARDLLEYIAFKIESKHFPQPILHGLPDFPYRSVDIVLEHKGLSMLSDVKRVALAEYCLLNDNPAQRLFVVIDDLLAGPTSDLKNLEDDAFLEFLKRAPWQAAGVPLESVSSKIHRRLSELREGLLQRFPASEFPAIYSWIGTALEFGESTLADRGLFAELYRLDTSDFNGAVNGILSKIGIPILVNSDGHLGTSLGGEESKDQFIQLLLAYELSEYLSQERLDCPMCSVCERDRPSLMNSSCTEAPFRRAKDAPDDMCPFGQFAKSHGLDKVTWYLNGRVVSSQASHWDE
jgi:hypothetical protein